MVLTRTWSWRGTGKRLGVKTCLLWCCGVSYRGMTRLVRRRLNLGNVQGKSGVVVCWLCLRDKNARRKDTSGRTNVKSRDIVSISMSRGSLRVGGSFLDFACVGVNGGDVVVDADEHDFFGAVFSSDVEFAHVAGPAEGA